MSDERLWGVPHAEHMQFDAASVYEEIECDRDEDDRSPITIEEWSVRGARSDAPDAQTVLEFIAERASEEGDEDYYEVWWNAGTDEVRALINQALDKLAERITYRMADKKIADHVITFDDEGEPLLDGELLYTKRSSLDAEVPKS